MRKKGVSAIIATVLIVLLTIVAIGVIAGFVVPFVRESLAGAGACLPYRTYLEFDESFGFNCFNGSEIYFSVKANILEDLEAEEPGEFRVVFVGEETSESVIVKEGMMEEIKMLSGEGVEVPKKGDIITYVYNDSKGEGFESMEIYPVLETGKICEKTDSIKLISCG